MKATCRQQRSIEDLLKAESSRESDLDRQFAWDIVWEKYLGRLSHRRIGGWPISRPIVANRTARNSSLSHILLRPADGAGRRPSTDC